MELLILLASLGVVYLLAWGAAWLLARIAPPPNWLRPALPWLLVQIYLVGGLLLTGDLPGAPRAVLRLGLLAGALSLALGAATLLKSRQNPWRHLAAWALAGTLPWALALLLELTLQAAAYFRP